MRALSRVELMGMMRTGSRWLVAVLVASVVASGHAVATPQDTAPSAVAVVVTTSSAIVTWAPGPQVADSYRVYGYDGNWQLLAEVPTVEGYAALVEGTYDLFAVTGVLKGQESAPTTTSSDSGCNVTVTQNPPGVSVGGCPIFVPGVPGAGLGDKVPLWLVLY